MELQDRSRLYPTLPQSQGSLYIGNDGRLQYAPVSGVPVGLSPSVPQTPPISNTLQYYYQQLPIASVQPTSSDTLQAQRSLDYWAKWVRIVNIILFALTGTFVIIWATELIKPSPYEQKIHRPFDTIMKFIIFILLLITFKLGVKAGTLKTSIAAKRFLKMLIFIGILGLTLAGFKAYWKMKRRHGHRKQHNDDIPEDIEKSDEGRPSARLLQDVMDHADHAGDTDDTEDANDNDDDAEEEEDEDADAEDSDDANDSDDDDESEDSYDGEEASKERSPSRMLRVIDDDGIKNRNHEYKPNRHNSDLGNKKGDEEGDFERSKHKSYKGKKNFHIGGMILLGIYAIVVFMAYKLYRAARNYEQKSQSGNIPIVPVIVQQPVQAYSPGLQPGNIPVGAPVHH
ncbi:hypothetical protein SteCoe_10454 [Stentor coeruleus]|uniref:Uncharacterized protein n=1 Tax=Stentor coeruleus TaxID=5963 RepID=A0A1R2CFK5_9CILI|nr:hypothetical protein SteCoe_10454 [Stentor coeruleus]